MTRVFILVMLDQWTEGKETWGFGKDELFL